MLPLLLQPKLLLAYLVTSFVLFTNTAIGEISPLEEIDFIDMLSESAVSLMLFAWIVFILRAKSDKRIEYFLYLGFVGIYIGFAQDFNEEFTELSGNQIWKILLEDIPLPLGAFLASIGFMLWSNEQVAIRDSVLQAKERMEILSVTDELTGIGNKRALTRDLDVLVQSCQLTNTELCLAVIDLDNFKKINDTYGHELGDQVLAQLGRVLSMNRRGGDKAYRYGGEEFILVLPNCNINNAVKTLLIAPPVLA